MLNEVNSFTEKGAVDAIVAGCGNGGTTYGSEFRGGCNNGADKTGLISQYKV